LFFSFNDESKSALTGEGADSAGIQLARFWLFIAKPQELLEADPSYYQAVDQRRLIGHKVMAGSRNFASLCGSIREKDPANPAGQMVPKPEHAVPRVLE
jgi:hypothetical protein